MGLRVLVVDDSAVMRHLICRTLRLTGLTWDRMEEAGDGAVALAALAESSFDLALVDINMPVMDGEELINRLRSDARHRDMAVLVVSTESGQTRLARLTPKVEGFVHKPFSPEQLLDQITLMMGVPDVC
jgi:two-component system, chemotaxis family, chemotaxis protein CheY